MFRTGHKLSVSLVLFFASFPLMRLSGWFGLGVPVGLVLSILYWFDLGRELREAPAEKRLLRTLGLLTGVPQALFGGFCLLVGLAIVAWVLYNSFWQGDPHYTGGFLTLAWVLCLSCSALASLQTRFDVLLPMWPNPRFEPTAANAYRWQYPPRYVRRPRLKRDVRP